MIRLVLLPSVLALAVAPSSVPPHLPLATAWETVPVVLNVGQEKRFLVGYWAEPMCDDLRLVKMRIRNVSEGDNEISFRGRKPGKTLCRVATSVSPDATFVLIPVVVH